MKKLLNKKYKIGQIVSLFSANLISIPIGIITSIFLTRTLGPINFGNYTFLLNVFLISVVIANLGFFWASNRALVLTNDPDKAREYYGASLYFVLIIYLVITIGLFFYSVIDQNLVEKKIQGIFQILIPFSFVFLFTRYFEDLFQADNKIDLLIKSRVFPKILFLLIILIFYFFYKDIDLLTVWILFIGSQILVFAFIIHKLKVSFENFNIRVFEIRKFNKEYGFDLYIGSLFNKGFGYLTGILIGYFGESNMNVGFYSLAMSFSSPLSLIPNVIATTHYKDFSVQNRIYSKLIFLTVLLSLSALIMIWIIVPLFVNNFYGLEYSPVIKLNIILSIAYAFQGFGDFFNRYLGANGQGKSLRNSSIIVGASLFIVSIILIPYLGVTGAAYSQIIGSFIYFSVIFFYYKVFINTNKADENFNLIK